jgi:hypothetical protein
VVSLGDSTYAMRWGPDTALEAVPQGPSHIAPIAMQLSDAMAMGAARSHTTAMNRARNGRHHIIADECNTRWAFSCAKLSGR